MTLHCLKNARGPALLDLSSVRNHSRARPSEPHHKRGAATVAIRSISTIAARSALVSATRPATSMLSGGTHEHARAGADTLSAAMATAAPSAPGDDIIITGEAWSLEAELVMQPARLAGRLLRHIRHDDQHVVALRSRAIRASFYSTDLGFQSETGPGLASCNGRRRLAAE